MVNILNCIYVNYNIKVQMSFNLLLVQWLYFFFIRIVFLPLYKSAQWELSVNLVMAGLGYKDSFLKIIFVQLEESLRVSNECILFMICIMILMIIKYQSKVSGWTLCYIRITYLPITFGKSVYLITILSDPLPLQRLSSYNCEW